MPWVTATPADFIATLEKSGESEVRMALARGDAWVVHGNHKSVIEDWLRTKESRRVEAIARRASRNAIFANIIAITAIAITIKDQIVELVISWLH